MAEASATSRLKCLCYCGPRRRSAGGLWCPLVELPRSLACLFCVEAFRLVIGLRVPRLELPSIAGWVRGGLLGCRRADGEGEEAEAEAENKE